MTRNKKNERACVAVVGSGPAGLMAAHTLSKAGIETILIEQKAHVGRKLMIAARSGLNVSNDGGFESWKKRVTGLPAALLKKIWNALPREEWMSELQALGMQTFCGSTGRDFVSGHSAAPMLRAWLKQLEQNGVRLQLKTAVQDWKVQTHGIQLNLNGKDLWVDAVCFALGGGSWSRAKVSWPEMFERHAVECEPFASSNAGFEVHWPAGFLKEAEGEALKNITLTSVNGVRHGEVVITKYGLEGTPVYDVGVSGEVFLDLKPDLDLQKLIQRLKSVRENMSPLRRARKVLNLSTAAQALLFHLLAPAEKNDLERCAAAIKKFPLVLGKQQGLARAISSRGGISVSEIDDNLQLKKHPGIYVAGEMLSWDAPTGGFLIHVSAAMGRVAALNIVKELRSTQVQLPVRAARKNNSR